MADRIVVLNAGEIAQVGAPLELYHKPANLFVAGFIGNPKMNFLKVICKSVGAEGVTVEYEGQTVTVPVEPRAGLEGRHLTLGIRPEHTGLETADLNVKVSPSVIERLGVNTIAYGVAPTGENYCALLSGSAPVVVDEPIITGIKASDCHLFDESGIALERRVDLSVLKLIQ